MKTLILASNNANKIKEIRELLKEYNIEVKGLKELGLGDPVEDGKTFQENALIKAKYAFEKTKLPTLADDSGFCIDSINNFPGLCSARFAEAVGTYPEAMKILNDCINQNDKKAHFTTCLAFIDEQGREYIFEGVLDGEFVYPPRGTNGFGYCSCFTPKGCSETFGEMSNEKRIKINHRAIALKKFLEFLKESLVV